MIVTLSTYTRCANAALRAATRVRHSAAVESAHHAKRLLSAFDALAPWVPDPETEAEIESLVVATQAAVLRKRTDEERNAAIVTALASGWRSATSMADEVRMNPEDCLRRCLAMTEAGVLQAQPNGRATLFARKE